LPSFWFSSFPRPVKRNRSYVTLIRAKHGCVREHQPQRVAFAVLRLVFDTAALQSFKTPRVFTLVATLRIGWFGQSRLSRKNCYGVVSAWVEGRVAPGMLANGPVTTGADCRVKAMFVQRRFRSADRSTSA